MKPDKILSEREYLELAETILMADSWRDFLNDCEDEYLEVNPKFYALLCKAIEKLQSPEWESTDILLQGNPNLSFTDALSLRLKHLINLQQLVKARAEKPSFPESFLNLLKKYSEIIPDFWSEVDNEDLFAACKRDFNYFIRLQSEVSEEGFLDKLNKHIKSYQDEIVKHEKRFIEAQPKPGQEGQRVLIKQEDETFSHASKIRQNDYESIYKLFRAELLIKIDFLNLLFLNKPASKPKPAPQALTFEALFQFRPDFNKAIKLLECPLPDESIAVKNGIWEYEGKSGKALIVAFADVLKQKLSIRSDISANDVAQVVAMHFGVEWPERGHRARWKEGVKNKGEAYDYVGFRKHFRSQP